MKRSLFRLAVCEFDSLLDALTTAQYLSPHESLAQALTRTADALGVCPQAVNHAITWLQVKPATPIGRLRRTELMQLARSIHRFWRQAGTAAAAAAGAAQPSERPS
jgi:hypothetical protein